MIPDIKFDHSPLLIHVDSKACLTPSKSYIFRFEAAWNLKDGVSHTIKEAWGKVAGGEDAASTTSKRLVN